MAIRKNGSEVTREEFKRMLSEAPDNTDVEIEVTLNLNQIKKSLATNHNIDEVSNGELTSVLYEIFVVDELLGSPSQEISSSQLTYSGEQCTIRVKLFTGTS